MEKNYKQWKNIHYSWDDIDHFKEYGGLFPGVHTVTFQDGSLSVDFICNKHVLSARGRVLPVFLTGAISDRQKKQGPFFTGLGITNELEIPMISISDPSVDTDAELNLAWYAGGLSNRVTDSIIELLEVISETLEAELLFIGGSGGGFAALQLSRTFKDNCSVFVWNPQTDIYEYSERHVKLYLRSQFNFAHSSLARDDWKQFCKIRTGKWIQSSVLDADTLRAPRRLVYLQNTTDWHKDKHLLPLWISSCNKELSNGENYLDENHLVYVHDLASGHNPPSAEIIKRVVDSLVNPGVQVNRIDLNASNT
ncbi:hypothetical protein [Glutamicibacter endophyticus]|uniref:hypothetical protein n=1 Tax=Glutamicibacter endophyticus TaxID=1522174 RepID=UPI003AEFCA03